MCQKAFAPSTGIFDEKEEDLWDCETTKGIVHPIEWDRKREQLENERHFDRNSSNYQA
jgi:hypothetical protein